MEYRPPRERFSALKPGRVVAMIWHGGSVEPIAIVLLLAASVSASGDRAAPTASHDDLMRAETATPAGKRLREGTRLVDQIGNFKLSADRASFTTADGQYRLDGLPNLNLERIVRTLRDHPDQLVWSVSGTVTEYQGANYLLITRAVLKSKRSQRTTTPIQPPGLPTPAP